MAANQGAQNPKVEKPQTPAAPVKKEDPKPPAVSDKNAEAWAKLTEKEAHLTKKEKEIEEREKKLKSVEEEKTKAEVEAKKKADEEAEAKRLAQLPEVERKVETVKKEMEEKLAKVSQTAEQLAAKNKQEEIDLAVKSQVDYIEKLAKADPDKYELVLAKSAAPAVLKTMLAFMQERGEELTHEQGLDMIEELLRKEADAVAETKYLKTKMVSGSKPQDPKPGSKAPELTIQNNMGGPSAPEQLPADPDARWKALTKKHFGAR